MNHKGQILYDISDSSFFVRNQKEVELICESLSEYEGKVRGECTAYGFNLTGESKYQNFFVSIGFFRKQKTSNGILILQDSINENYREIIVNGLAPDLLVKVGSKSVFRFHYKHQTELKNGRIISSNSPIKPELTAVLSKLNVTKLLVKKGTLTSFSAGELKDVKIWVAFVFRLVDVFKS